MIKNLMILEMVMILSINIYCSIDLSFISYPHYLNIFFVLLLVALLQLFDTVLVFFVWPLSNCNKIHYKRFTGSSDNDFQCFDFLPKDFFKWNRLSLEKVVNLPVLFAIITSYTSVASKRLILT